MPGKEERKLDLFRGDPPAPQCMADGGDGRGHGGGGHDHGDGHICNCAQEHADSIEGVDERWLYWDIDTENVRCLNEDEEHTVLHAIKPRAERHDTTKWLESDADEQLIIKIPFTGSVKLKCFSLGSGPGGHGPLKVKAFINRDDIDFDNVNAIPPVQEWELPPDNPVDAYHMFKVAKFGQVRTLTLFVDTNYGNDTTQITYLNFRGIFTHIHTGPVEAVYELKPLPDDLRNKIDDSLSNMPGC